MERGMKLCVITLLFFLIFSFAQKLWFYEIIYFLKMLYSFQRDVPNWCLFLKKKFSKPFIAFETLKALKIHAFHFQQLMF